MSIHFEGRQTTLQPKQQTLTIFPDCNVPVTEKVRPSKLVHIWRGVQNRVFFVFFIHFRPFFRCGTECLGVNFFVSTFPQILD